ncbi:MAG TPA: EAL domain-containing protein [Iamia sp.]|nr:EAL domain-containing protein [Iamia sp.]
MPLSIDWVHRWKEPDPATLVRLAAALVLAGGLCGAATAVGGRIEDAARTETVRRAELVADLGFATAMSDGELTAGDTRDAAAQTAVAREALGITRVVVWDRSGVVFADPGPTAGAAPPALVRRALSEGSTATGPVVDGDATRQGFAVVVPLDQDYAAELDFAEGPIEDTLTMARRVVYGLILAEAIAVYLAIGPALTWAAERMPTHADRQQAAAVGSVRAALDEGALELWYQPKVAIATGEVLGVEALLRWRHPTRGVLPPSEVIDVAELDDQLLDDVTTHVVCEAAAATARWSAARVSLPVAVNISPATFRRNAVPALVDTALRTAGAPPGMLSVEMTETALMDSADEVVDSVRELRQRGVAVALDDFGTGHSSLQRIAELQLDELKIDRSFVASLASDARERRVVSLIIDLAKDLGAIVTAEGVETTAQLDTLASLGCDVIQGYLIAKPMPERDLLRWLHEHTHSTGPAVGTPSRRRIDAWPR